MLAIDVLIVRWISDDQPGFVECELIDRFGIAWRFIAKLPIVSTCSLSGQSGFPQPGLIACKVRPIGRDDSGRQIVEIDTETPWGVEAVDGTTRFHVFADQLVVLAD